MAEIYSDINFKFIKSATLGVEKLTDDESVKQSIKNILFTNKGEVPFNPEFGSNIKEILFEKFGPVAEIQLEQEILFALDNFEPRIVINNIIIESDYDNHEYNVTLFYTIRRLNIESELQITLSTQGI